jgi:cobalamin-dependent methionine synthase I
LTIIGESINDSVPSTKVLFDANDINGLLELAKTQDEKGAGYIDVNVGRRTPEFMADMVKKIQSVTAKPLSIDTPDIALEDVRPLQNPAIHADLAGVRTLGTRPGRAQPDC